MTRLTRGELTKVNRELLKIGQRICSCCWRRQSVSEFYRSGRYYRGDCKRCFAATRPARPRTRIDAERQREYDRRWREAHPDRARESRRQAAKRWRMRRALAQTA